MVGSSDEAFEDTLYLSNFSSNVFLVTEGEEVEASKALIDECNEKENIEVLKAKVKSILGDGFVKSIVISDFDRKEDVEIPVDGVFISVGGIPMTSLVKRTEVTVDRRGCIKVDRRQATNLEGVFAAGDCTCGGMQVVTAVGEGATAALQVYRYVKKLKR